MLNSVLLFFDMSGGEMILIALVALLVLGPQKMSEVARKAGKMMNEVRRVSSDFTSQLNEETSSLKDELHGVKDTLRDATKTIKDELLNQKQEVSKNLDPNTPQNTNEPSYDPYDMSKDPSEKESHPKSVSDHNSTEHSDTQPVLKEQQADKNPTSNQDKTNP